MINSHSYSYWQGSYQNLNYNRWLILIIKQSKFFYILVKVLLNIQSATSSIKLERPACVCRLCCVRHLPVVSVAGSFQSPRLSEHEAGSPVGRWSAGHVCGALACPRTAHTRVHLLVLNILQPRHRDSNITIHCHKLHCYDNLIDDHFGVYYETL